MGNGTESVTTLTPTQRALLATIREAPGDDSIRLIYADACDDAGQHERGELIRVQCQIKDLEFNHLALQPRGGRGPKAELTPAYEALRRRERELLSANIGAWTDFLPEELMTKECPHCIEQSPDPETNVVECRRCDSTGRVFNDDVVEFRRGFLSTIRLPLAAFCGEQCSLCALWERQFGRPTHNYKDCERCHGSGRTPGIARQLFDVEPITTVTFSDREPYHNGAGYAWFKNTRLNGRDEVPPEANLPDELFAIVQIHKDAHHVIGYRWAAFPSRAAALSALSDAACVYAKNLVKEKEDAAV